MDQEKPPPGARPSEEIIAAFKQGLAALRKVRGRKAVIGALALDAYKATRNTTDVDFLVFCADRHWFRLGETLDRPSLRLDRGWLDRHPFIRPVVLRFRHGTVPVDVIRPRDAHERGLRLRLIPARIGGRACRVLPPEDYVLLKAKAQRERDLDDAIRVVNRNLDDLDYRYLRRWSLKLGLREEVDYIVAQAERAPGG